MTDHNGEKPQRHHAEIAGVEEEIDKERHQGAGIMATRGGGERPLHDQFTEAVVWSWEFFRRGTCLSEFGFQADLKFARTLLPALAADGEIVLEV